MNLFYHIAIFIVSIAALSWAGRKLVEVLMRISRFLKWREFVSAFVIMALATSLTNFFVDVSAAVHKIPQLAFGDIVGGNVVDATLIMGLAAIFSREGLLAESRMVQTSAVFTSIIAVLPLILVLDGNLSRVDGVILILFFITYFLWLFSKGERFKKIYEENVKPSPENGPAGLKGFFKNIGIAIIAIILLLLASQGIIKSAQTFSLVLGVPISLVGVLIVGLGNCFPEGYFSILSARKGEGWLVLGNMMGSIIICATLVLGIVAIISPFEITDFSPYALARFFMAAAAIFFLLVIKSGKRITRKEGLALIGLYILFLLSEIFFKNYF